MSDASVAPLSDEARGPSASGILMAFLLVVVAAMTHYGAFKWHALFLMLGALGVCAHLHLRPTWRPLSETALLTGLLIAFLAVIICVPTGQNELQVEYTVPGSFHPWKRVNNYGMAIYILMTAALAGALSYLDRGGRSRFARGRFIALILIAAICRVLILQSSPNPKIDVYVSQTSGAKGLLIALASESERDERIALVAENDAEAQMLRKSRNVYSQVFPSPYWSEQRMGPRTERDGTPRPGAWFDHYGYPPATVYMNALGWWAFKDVRGAWLICDLIAAACLYFIARRARPGAEHTRFCELITLGFLFLPRSLFVLEQSWTEPLVLATMGVFAALMARPSGILARGAALGLWFSSKQYVVLAAPMLLKLRRLRWSVWVIGGAVGAATIVPYALWDWSALYHDVLGFFLSSEVRPDALSICGALKRTMNVELPWQIVTPLWLAGIGFFTWTMRRTLGGMLFATASAWLFFFLLGKQAFMNYWHVILYALLLAAAATPASEEQTTEP